MEYKAKITQIIKEEEYKKFGFIKYPNHDYLNLMPIELWNDINTKTNNILSWINTIVFIFFGLILFPIGMVFKKDWVAGIGLLIFFLGMFFNVFYTSYRNKKVFNKYWYFKSPYPIEKPHYYKEGDIVKIKITLEGDKL